MIFVVYWLLYDGVCIKIVPDNKKSGTKSGTIYRRVLRTNNNSDNPKCPLERVETHNNVYKLPLLILIGCTNDTDYQCF